MTRWLFTSAVAISVLGCGGSADGDSSPSGGSGGATSGGSGGAVSGGGSGGAVSGGGSGGATGGSGGTGAIGGGSGGAAGGAAGAGTGGVSGAAGQAGSGGGAGGPGVSCGGATCTAAEACLVCDPTGAQSPKTCVTGFGDTCPTFPNLRLFCDDHGDCTATEKCMMVEGSVGTYAQCIEPSACSEDCSCGPGAFAQVCTTLADCPACATTCKPYQQSGQGGSFPVNVCG
jgi:hypothetical protein